jgi:hypothetical protein
LMAKRGGQPPCRAWNGLPHLTSQTARQCPQQKEEQMSLDYGFGRWESDEKRRRQWTAKFQALDEVDRSYFHNVLPWLCLGVDVGEILPSTVGIFVARLKLAQPDTYEREMKWIREERKCESMTDYLPRFYGFSSNVATLTNAEWVKRRMEIMRQKLPAFDKSREVYNREMKACLDGVKPAPEDKLYKED